MPSSNENESAKPRSRPSAELWKWSFWRKIEVASGVSVPRFGSLFSRSATVAADSSPDCHSRRIGDRRERMRAAPQVRPTYGDLIAAHPMSRSMMTRSMSAMVCQRWPPHGFKSNGGEFAGHGEKRKSAEKCTIASGSKGAC
jgi:hypothetical protein